MKKILKNFLIQILFSEVKLFLLVKKPKIIAITGNIGKTSTKDAIYSVVSLKYSTRASRKSFNSDIGVPLTILDLDNAWSNVFGWILNITKGFFSVFKKAPEFLILEVGADKKGDIEKIAKLIKADFVVYTAIPDTPTHLVNYKSVDELIDEKANLAKYAKKDAVIFYDKDSLNTYNLASRFDNKKIAYGLSSNEIELKELEYTCKDGKAHAMRARFNFFAEEFDFNFDKNIGKHQLYPILAALSVARYLNIDLRKAKDVLEQRERTRGRMSLLDAKAGAKMIDDSYNASPTPVLAALDVLGKFSCIKGKKIAVLGDMAELGKKSDVAHKEVLEKAMSVADYVFVLGSNFKFAAENLAYAKDKLFCFGQSEHEKLVLKLREFIGEGDLILIKGSQSARMEKISKALLKEAQDAKDCLVRQEKEWENR